jgi:hypothetical protein
MIQILNQVFEIQNKMSQLDLLDKFNRNIAKLIHICEEEGYTMHNPSGERYKESRADCEANIVGRLTEHMTVTQVIKPIIYKQGDKGEKTLVQKGIVIIESN